jgi:putative phosphoribosyl transferase
LASAQIKTTPKQETVTTGSGFGSWGCVMLFREEDEDEETLPFEDRAEAGRILATKLSAYSGRDDVLVLGLPRGGVPVAFQVAQALKAPLDVFVVRKLGTPWNRELGMGAIAPGGVQILDLSIVRELCVTDQAIREVAAEELQELERRERLYRSGRPPLSVAGKTVILVDDGIATGSSILAAVAALRRQQAARIVVAIPVAPAHACSAIRMEADEVVSVAEPEMFFAVSQWYADFSQTTDDDVRALLEEAGRSMPRAA